MEETRAEVKNTRGHRIVRGLETQVRHNQGNGDTKGQKVSAPTDRGL